MAIEAKWASWIRDRDPPVHRPFDSLFRLTVHREASDIDLQLSSYEATRRANVLMNQAPPENRAPLFHPHYNFVSDEYASLVLPATYLFANDEIESIGRPVTVKLFDGAGPPDKSRVSTLSAHFRDADWVLATTVMPAAQRFTLRLPPLTRDSVGTVEAILKLRLRQLGDARIFVVGQRALLKDPDRLMVLRVTKGEDGSFGVDVIDNSPDATPPQLFYDVVHDVLELHRILSDPKAASPPSPEPPSPDRPNVSVWRSGSSPLEPSLFVGRTYELAVLEEQFRRGSRAGMIVGMRGSGKTALARVFAERYIEHLFSGGVSFVDATFLSPDIPAQVLEELAGVGSPSSGPHLVVIDNIERPTPFLKRVVRQLLARDVQVLVVGTRPVLEEVEFAVEPGSLSHADIDDLVGAVLGHSSAQTIDALRASSGGSPLVVRMALQWLSENQPADVSNFLELLQPFHQRGVVSRAGVVHSKYERMAVSTVEEVSDELREYVAREGLDTGRSPLVLFRDAVVRLLAGRGYDVSSPEEREADVLSLFAARRGEASFVGVVEVKHVALRHLVSVSLVKYVHGEVDVHRAHAQLVLGKSAFVGSSAEIFEASNVGLSLQSYAQLHAWLRELASFD